MALEILQENRELILDFDSNDAHHIIWTTIKIYLCIILRSSVTIFNIHTDTSVVDEWRSIIECFLEKFPNASNDILTLLSRNGGSYLSEGDEYDQLLSSSISSHEISKDDLNLVAIDINKARSFRVKYIGIPLPETLTLTLQLLDCPFKIPRVSAINLISFMAQTLSKKNADSIKENEEKNITMKLSDSVVITLIQALIELLPQVCVTISRFATYCSLWISLIQVDFIKRLNAQSDTLAFLIHLFLGSKSPGPQISKDINSIFELKDLSQLFSIGLTSASNDSSSAKSSATTPIIMDESGVVLDQASLFNEKNDELASGKELFEKSRAKLLTAIYHLVKYATSENIEMTPLSKAMLLHEEFRSVLLSSMSSSEETGQLLVMLCFGDDKKIEGLFNMLTHKLFDISSIGATNTASTSRACESCIQSIILSDPSKVLERLSKILV